MGNEILIIRGVGAREINADAIGKGRTKEQIKDFMRKIALALSQSEGTSNETASKVNNTSTSSPSKTQEV